MTSTSLPKIDMLALKELDSAGYMFKLPNVPSIPAPYRSESVGLDIIKELLHTALQRLNEHNNMIDYADNTDADDTQAQTIAQQEAYQAVVDAQEILRAIVTAETVWMGESE